MGELEVRFARGEPATRISVDFLFQNLVLGRESLNLSLHACVFTMQALKLYAHLLFCDRRLLQLFDNSRVVMDLFLDDFSENIVVYLMELGIQKREF